MHFRKTKPVLLQGTLEYMMFFGMFIIAGLIALDAFNAHQSAIMNFRFSY